jgi:peptidoglycan/xylan/chitin deacetylase (PgdA/CDA1 family)
MPVVNEIRRGAEGIRRRVRQGASWFAPRGVILLYHRVIEFRSDPQLLAVTPKHFAEHLEVIARLGEPTRLSQLDRALDRPIRKMPPIVVTFDDGYADNLYVAKPLLAQYGAPAAVFVSSGHVRAQREFLHDELEKILLQPGRLPPRLTLAIAGQMHHWDLGAAAEYRDGDYRNHRHWNILSQQTPTQRHQVYRSLCEVLCPLSSDERSVSLCQLLEWSQVDPQARPSHRPLTAAELTRLHQGDLVEIGGHTIDHPVLSRLSEAAQRAQIAGCKSELENMLGSPVTAFAYPYGTRHDYSAATVTAVKAAGFSQACANCAGLIRRDTDRWQLPRLLVRDWPAAVFEQQLRTWLCDLS